MAFTNNNKLNPIVVDAIIGSINPETEKSLARLTIELLGKRLIQLDNEIRRAQEDHKRVQDIRNDLLDNFPENDNK